MSKNLKSDLIRIGVVAVEPIRLAGLKSIFDLPAELGQPQLSPVVGTLAELLADPGLGYLVIDLLAFPGGLQALESIRKLRPKLRLIVIGPEGDDELVLSSIIAGARAYLDLTADPEIVRQAVHIVTSGSIWAPRRLLSRLIDRLLNVPETSPANTDPRLTARERQVLELILLARSNREIASALGIEERTVKAYVGRLLRKTGANNRIKLSMSALNRSLLSPEKQSGPAMAGAGRKRSD
jgi:DNA-binding NarL/FixJ family response regulator